jgi:hypothetical protein
MTKHELYWDEGNGRVVKENDDGYYALIIRGCDTSITIETYEVYEHGVGARIDIAYTKEDKKNHNMHDYRELILRQHGLTFSDLGNLVTLTIPSNKYDELMEKYYG